MYDLSVIVPVYKTKDYIRDCVDSILSNQVTMEIILVDDGSSDDCCLICDDYAARFDSIKVIHKENGGLSSARNAGLDIAKGDYVAFVDSDDMVDCNMFSKMLNQILKLNADIACCGMKILGSGNPYMDYSEWQAEYNNENCIQLLLSRNGTGDFYMNKVFRRELFKDIRLPVGKYYEDIFSMYKVFDKAKKVVCINEPLYSYRIHNQSISHSAGFNPKLLDYPFACKAECEYVRINKPDYSDLALAKYANAINQLSVKKSILFGNSKEAKACFHTLTDLFTQDIKTIEDNKYCSERLKYEILLMQKSKVALKRYIRKTDLYYSLHNHPYLQNKIHRFFSLPNFSKALKYQY